MFIPTDQLVRTAVRTNVTICLNPIRIRSYTWRRETSLVSREARTYDYDITYPYLQQQHNTTTTKIQHNTTQHNTTQHNTTQQNTTHNTIQHNTTQHNTTQHNTTQHNTTQHNTTQHNTTPY